jgi:hypothetical protein
MLSPLKLRKTSVFSLTSSIQHFIRELSQCDQQAEKEFKLSFSEEMIV